MQQNPYKSEEFVIASNVQTYSQTTSAVFNDVNNSKETLFVMCPGRGFYNNLWQTTFDLNNLSKTDPTSPPDGDPINHSKLTDMSNWTTTELNIEVSNGKPSIIAVAQSLFLFVNSNSGLLAYRYEPATNNNPTAQWNPQSIQLLESDGKTAPVPNSMLFPSNFPGPLPSFEKIGADVSVTAVGDNTVIVTCASASSSTYSNGGTFVGIYDTNEIDTKKNQWTARWHTYFAIGDASSPMNPQNTLYVSTEWYSTLDQNNNLSQYLFVLTQSPTAPTDPAQIPPRFTIYNMPMTIEDAGEGKTNVSLADGTASGSNNSSTMPNAEFSMFFTDLKRDPGGRLVVWNTPRVINSGQDLFYSSHIGTDAPLDDFSFDNFSTPAERNGILDVSDDAKIFPSSLIYTFGGGQYETTMKDQNGNTIRLQNYPVYDFMFYGNTLKCQVNRVGTIQVTEDAGLRSPQWKKDPNTNKDIEKFIIGGIINGPLPLPYENFVGYSPGSGDTDWGTLTYGTEKDDTESRSIKSSWSVGFKTSTEVTKGVGPAFDISFDAGQGSVSTTSTETSNSFSLDQHSKVDYADGVPTIQPSGNIMQLSAQFAITAFNYLDEYGTSVVSTDGSAADAPKSATVLTSLNSPIIKNFTPYDVTPGDLMSYTPETFNKTMQQLGYSGTNYYGEIICQNAYPFGNPNAPYLSFSWDKNGGGSSGFQQFTSSYKENDWTFDGSIYGGVSGGFGADVFGMGFEAQFKFLVGGSFSHESSESENDTFKWGIGLSGNSWGPPPSDTDGAVKSYAFRLFFLPVPDEQLSPLPEPKKLYWTNELIRHIPAGSDYTGDQIDENSAVWKAVYIVTDIEYVRSANSENVPDDYSYQNDYLDLPSVYQGDSSSAKQSDAQISDGNFCDDAEKRTDEN